MGKPATWPSLTLANVYGVTETASPASIMPLDAGRHYLDSVGKVVACGAASAAGFIEGYWKSGDIGSIDEHGFVRVFDRKKDMINRGGFKIFSSEVENVLCEHPAVFEAAVVGVPCPVLGERVYAFVVVKDNGAGEADLKTFCASRLADYQVPERFVISETPLPRNPNGKILKLELRAATI